MATVARGRGRPARGTSVTRDDLLDAAATLFAERGVETVSVADIAVHCGVDRASVYYHLGDRPAVVRALGERWFDSLFGAMERLALVARPDVRLAAYLILEHEVLVPHRRAVLTLLASAGQGARPVRPETATAAQVDGLTLRLERLDARLRAWCGEACAEGRLDVHDLDTAVGAVDAFALGALLDGEPRDRAAAARFRDRLALVLRGLGAQDPVEVVTEAARAASQVLSSRE